MANRNIIPGPGKATDGISHVAGRAIVPYINWELLKRRFLENEEYASPTQWLYHEMMWPLAKIKNGGTTKHISGWSVEKATFEQRKTEYLMKMMIEEQRRRLPGLLKAKLLIVAKTIADVGKWDRLDSKEKKLCYDILKTELGEPTSIKTVGLVVPKDPVEALLEEYGMMKDGRIIIDGDESTTSTSDSEAVAALDSGSLTQVSQN